MPLLTPSDRNPLTSGPAPTERPPHLPGAIGGSMEIWAKRGHCKSSLPLGGRRLESIMPVRRSHGQT